MTVGPLLVDALRPICQTAGVPLDVHLMVERPERLIPEFARAGANILTVHVETCPHLHRTIQQIKSEGLRAGVTLNPATPLITLEEILPEVDQVLVMSVNPGFGGQEFIPSSLERIARIRSMLSALGLNKIDIEVDGGIKPDNVASILEAGATVLVVGSAIFNQRASIGDNLAAVRRAMG
jgi:ribulose-phosphate 3-epimerase